MKKNRETKWKKMELGDTKNDGRKNEKKFTNELSRPKKLCCIERSISTSCFKA